MFNETTSEKQGKRNQSQVVVSREYGDSQKSCLTYSMTVLLPENIALVDGGIVPKTKTAL
jgi:hypothetical protein